MKLEANAAPAAATLAFLRKSLRDSPAGDGVVDVRSVIYVLLP
jgi:hypothetical protein